MTPLKLGIGHSDFKTLRELGSYYVDKSMLIHDVLNRHAQITLLPRPRRFGKTLNLSMLRYFFEKTEASNQHLFEGLKILEYPEFMKHQGQYPVVYVTLKDTKEHSWDLAQLRIASIMAELYRSHDFLLSSHQLAPQEVEFFHSILSRKAPLTDLANALKFLVHLLHRVTGQKVVVLIDEYDIPIDASYQFGYYDEMINFSRNLLSAVLKDNSDLFKGVMTGILRVAKESIFSGLNNLDVYGVLDKDFSPHFGFTQEEVDQMLVDFEVSGNSQEVQRWYNGYCFGETTIYNPWSILHYLSKPSSDPQAYWVNTGSMTLIRDLIQQRSLRFQDNLKHLLKGNSIRTEVQQTISLRDLGKSDISVWSLLLMSGYLKPLSKEILEHKTFYKLAIPNLEVMSFYDSVIQQWLESEIGGDYLNDFQQAVIHGETGRFQETLQALVLSYLSCHDVTLDVPEKVYHAFVLGMLVQLQPFYWIESNHESGYGRYDVSLTPKNLEQVGIILEFKKINSTQKETAKTAMKSALKQIQEQEYATEMKKKGVSQILGFGVVVDKKKVWVEKVDLS